MTMKREKLDKRDIEKVNVGYKLENGVIGESVLLNLSDQEYSLPFKKEHYVV